MPEGYIFEKDTAPLTIGIKEQENLIKVYYNQENITEIQPPKTDVSSSTSDYLAGMFILGALGIC